MLLPLFSSVAKAAATPTPQPRGYLTLAGEHSAHLEVKKSRFLAKAWPVATAEDAVAGLAARTDRSANHNCHAWRMGQRSKAFDDGEPGGTAGHPILSAIEAEGLDRVCVLVIRHFGGIKLGTGGLARAYAAAARECLRTAPRIRVAPLVEVAVRAAPGALGATHRAAARLGARRVGQEAYDADGATATVLFVVEASVAEEFAEAGRVAGGQVEVTYPEAE
jgi:putative IMPACT (imprinted ancient) family translation regulator